MDRDLIEFYRAETRQSEHVCAAFIAAGVEPPRREVTDSIGFTFAQSAILDKAATPLPSL